MGHVGCVWDLKKNMSLNVKFIYIETRDLENGEDPSNLTPFLLLAAP